MTYRLHGLALVLALAACKGSSVDSGTPSKASTTSATTSAPSATTTTAPSATTSVAGATSATSGTTTVKGLPTGPTTAAARPRYLRRQRPFSAQASSVFDDKKTHEKHPAIDAFDGDRRTMWIEGASGDGQGEWLEATYSAPQKVWGVLVDTGVVRSKPGPTPGAVVDLFTQNAHAKQLRLRFDDGDVFARDVAEGETAILWEGIDRPATKVRVVADEVWPGSKWHDFGITEVAVLVDGTTFPTVPESMVQSEVDALATSAEPAKDAAKILGRFGANPPPAVVDGRSAVASLQKASLVNGSSAERVLQVSFLGTPDDQGMRDEDVYVVFLGAVGDRLLGLGSDSLTTRTKDGAPVEVALSKLHAASVDDLVFTWSSCSATGPKACHGLRAYGLGRGFPERMVNLLDETAPTVAESGAPRTVTTGGMTMSFDAKANAYR